MRTVQVRLMCGDADCEGEMTPTGECLTSSPPQYPHRCKMCGRHETVRGRTYPHLEYVEQLGIGEL